MDVHASSRGHPDHLRRKDPAVGGYRYQVRGQSGQLAVGVRVSQRGGLEHFKAALKGIGLHRRGLHAPASPCGSVGLCVDADQVISARKKLLQRRDCKGRSSHINHSHRRPLPGIIEWWRSQNNSPKNCSEIGEKLPPNSSVNPLQALVERPDIVVLSRFPSIRTSPELALT